MPAAVTRSPARDGDSLCPDPDPFLPVNAAAAVATRVTGNASGDVKWPVTRAVWKERSVAKVSDERAATIDAADGGPERQPARASAATGTGLGCGAHHAARGSTIFDAAGKARAQSHRDE